MTDIGVNFRSTATLVTDDAGQTYCLTSDAYPTTRGGATFGWEDSGMASRNRSATADPRLAGIHFASNAVERRWRLDLDATGDHTVEIAAGDLTSGQAESFALRDDATDFVDGGTGITTAAQFYDATNTLRTSAADWIANEAAVTHTFASQICRLVNGAGGNTTGGNSAIAHVRVAATSGGTTFQAAWARNANATMIQ